MSRFKKFTRSLVSGYFLLGANILFTLASVPLALKYLSLAEFGLWALTMQIGGYIALVDLGMGASVARILIDHKDDRIKGGYGSVVQTGVLVGLVQGFLILLVGTVLALVAGRLLRVPPELRNDFTGLMIGQCALLAFSFAGKIFLYLLTAHQRYDISNYAQAALFACSYGMMWFFFAEGFGVFSLLWGQVLSSLLTVAINVWGCVHLKLLPRRGEWGRPTRPLFNELFAYGRDIFLFALGGQLINTSQTLLLTRFFGLETAAVWNICTRTFSLLLQVIYRVFDYSSSALAEMMVRREKKLLAGRFQHIIVLSTSLSVAAATLFALCNGAFVQVWTSGRVNAATLGSNEIKDTPALVAKLQAHADLVSLYLWQQFPESLRREISAYIPAGEVANALQTNLVTEINRILVQSPIYDPERFAGVELRSEARAMLAHPVNIDAPLLLNRRLLDSAYRHELFHHELTRWRPHYDLLLAVWLVICVSVHAHTGLVGQTKRMHFLRFIFFFEGLAFIGLTVLLRRLEDIGVMLAASVVSSLVFSLPYGFLRTRQYLGLTWRELAAWHRAPLMLALRLVPVAMVVWWFGHNLPAWLQLALGSGVTGLWALVMLMRHGLDAELKRELLNRSSGRLHRGLARLLSIRHDVE